MKVKAILTALAMLLGYAASAQTGPSAWKEVTVMLFTSFILSIVASVIAYYICKWLDR